MPDRRILVVDDEPAITEVLATALIGAGFTVEPVETAPRAREKLLEGGLLVPTEVGHRFRNEVGHRFRFEAGHLFQSIPATDSDLKSATPG